MDSPWHLPGEWLKGALHVHTTNSDGRLTPQEVIDTYAACGYDFVVFSDHGKVTAPASVDGKGLVVIGGAEIGAGKSELGSSYHLLAVGLDDLAEGEIDTTTAQAAVDGLRAKGALVFVAHPYWSLLEEGGPAGRRVRWRRGVQRGLRVRDPAWRLGAALGLGDRNRATTAGRGGR